MSDQKRPSLLAWLALIAAILVGFLAVVTDCVVVP